jgi:sodium/proline symporter
MKIMINLIIVSIIIIYFIITFILGVIGMRYAKTVDQYMVASKLFGALVLGFSATSNIMTGFGFVGGPAQVYLRGATSLWITLAQSMAFGLTTYSIGKRLVAIREAIPGISGLGDIVYARFKSNAVRALFAVGILLGVFAYLGCQVLALGVVLYNILGIDILVAALSAYVIIIIISFLGGMASGHIVNFFQGVLMASAGVITLIAITLPAGGPGSIHQTLATVDPKLIDPLGIGTWALALTWWWIFCISHQPHLVVGYLALRDWKRLKWTGVLGGAGYMLCSLLWMWVGYGGKYLTVKGIIPTPKSPDDIAPYVLNYYLHPVISGIIYSGLVAAILGTSITFLVLASTAIVRDLSLALRGVTPKRELLWSRIVTVIVGVVAFIFGVYGGYYVLVIGALGWGYFVSVMAPLFLIGLNWKRATREGALASLVLAIALNLIFLYLERVVKWSLPYGVPGYIVSSAVAMIAIIVVSLFTKGAGGENLDPRIKIALEL